MRSSPGLPSYAAAGAAACAGCGLSVVEAFGRISSSTFCRAVRTWNTEHFSFDFVSFSLFWRVGVACGVQRIGFSEILRALHLVRLWIHVLREVFENLHFFHVAVNSNPEAFGLHSCRMEQRAQSMLLVVASLSAVRTLELTLFLRALHFSTAAAFFAASRSIPRALDDEIEGSGAGTPVFRLPGVLPHVN